MFGGGQGQQQKPGGFSVTNNATGSGQASTFSFSTAATAGTSNAPTNAGSTPAFSFSLPGSTAGAAAPTGFGFGASSSAAAGTKQESTALAGGSDAKKPMFSFNAPASAAAPSAPHTFGGAAATSGFSLANQPAAEKPAAATAEPAKSLFPSFGTAAAAPATAPTLSTPQPAAKTQFSFGATPAEAKPAFSFSTTTPTAPATSTSAAPDNATAKPAFSFAVPATPASKTVAAAPAETPATAQSPLTLSALKTPAPKAEIAPAATPTPSFSFGGAGAVKSAAGEVKPEQPKASLLTTAAAPKTEPPASLSSQSAVKPAEILTNLRGKTMDDILTEWQTELQNSVASFHRKAADIARIDARLIENSDKICKLVNETGAVQSAQTNLVSTLDYIESQQTQLDKELDQFETKLQSVLQANPAQKKLSTITASPYTGMSAEEERERTFELAETLNSELSHLNQNINETIESVNKLWKKSSSGGVLTGQEGDQTMELMTKILNEHFNQLQWIDATTQQLSQRLTEVKRISETVKPTPSWQ